MIQKLLGNKSVLDVHTEDLAKLSAQRNEALNIFVVTKNKLSIINNGLVAKQLEVTELIKNLTALNDQVGEEINSNQDTLQKISEVFKI